LIHFIFTDVIKAGTLSEVILEFRVARKPIFVPLRVEYYTQQLNEFYRTV